MTTPDLRKALIERLRNSGWISQNTNEVDDTPWKAADALEALTHDLNGGWQPRPIMLEIAAASDEHEMWERRWRALNRMYAIERCFADRDGRWGLRDVLDYVGRACGFSGESPPPQTISPDKGEGSNG